jgi:hypothetical protein
MDWGNPVERAPAAKPAAGAVRDRILEFIRIEPELIEPNPHNFRTHDAAQRAAFRAVLNQVGLAGACVVYRRGDRYRLIDGELRTSELQQAVPCLVLDVDDGEADLLLASMDPLSAMAGVNRSRLEALLAQGPVAQAAAADDELASLLRSQRLKAEIAEYVEGLAPVEQAPPGATPAAESRDLQAKWATAVGQIWTIGAHRVLVGASPRKAACEIERFAELTGETPSVETLELRADCATSPTR